MSSHCEGRKILHNVKKKTNRRKRLCVIVSLFFVLLMSTFSWICSSILTIIWYMVMVWSQVEQHSEVELNQTSLEARVAILATQKKSLEDENASLQQDLV